MTTSERTTDTALATGDLERDRRVEVLLEELVAGPGEDELPPDFARRVLALRPYAPWEVSRRSHWKAPAVVGLGLLAGSLGLALTPLWSLGPSTAVTVWGELLAVAFGRPLSTLATAFPLVAEGASRAAEAVPRSTTLLLGLLAAGGVISVGAALARLRGPALSATRRS